jgi:hypothetical protein
MELRIRRILLGRLRILPDLQRLGLVLTSCGDEVLDFDFDPTTR